MAHHARELEERKSRSMYIVLVASIDVLLLQCIEMARSASLAGLQIPVLHTCFVSLMKYEHTINALTGVRAF